VDNRIVTLIAIIIVIAGFVYFWPSSTEQEPLSNRPEMDTTSIADRPSFEASKDTVDTVRQPVGENLAPGTALVILQIESLEYEEDRLQSITGKIEEVLGYGSATSVINPGSTISLNISGYLEADSGVRKMITEGNIITVKLGDSKGMQAMGESANPSKWRIKEIIK